MHVPSRQKSALTSPRLHPAYLHTHSDFRENSHGDTGAEEPLLRTAAHRCADITTIGGKDAPEATASILGTVVWVTAIFTLNVGPNANLCRSFSSEYGVSGTAAATVAVGTGTIAAYLVVTRFMQGDWRFLPLIGCAHRSRLPNYNSVTIKIGCAGWKDSRSVVLTVLNSVTIKTGCAGVEGFESLADA